MKQSDMNAAASAAFAGVARSAWKQKKPRIAGLVSLSSST